jgi:YVTN family beta-propeller protein
MADQPAQGMGRPAIGTEFAGHRIVAVIGRGGMGVVYRARNVALDRERALKVIAPALSTDPRFRERFKRESRLAASIEHPNVIPVHAAGEEDGLLFLAMRLVAGSDLRRIVEAGGPLELGRAAAVIGGVAGALDAAHAAGLVHRDVKPGNVLVEQSHDGERVFLTDFGITRPAREGETVTGTGEFLGSPDYVAPEQAAGERVTPRTDIYALGCVAHYALTGGPPFVRDNDLATLFAHANASRPRVTAENPELPAAVDGVVTKAMAIDPAGRHGTAGELAADLQRALGEPVSVPIGPPSVAQAGEGAVTRPLPRRRPGRRRLVAAVLVAAATAAAAVVVVVTRDGDSRTAGDEPARGGSPTPKATATIPIDGAPNGLTVGGRRVWVAASGERVVEAIDPRRERVVPPAFAVAGAESVAAGFGSIWAVSPPQDVVYRLDPSGEDRPVEIKVGDSPSDIAVDRNWVWVANQSDSTVSRIDPATNQEDANEEVGIRPRSIATGGRTPVRSVSGSVWVANIDARSVSEIDARTAERVGNAIPVPGSRPNDIAVGEGAVWVIDNIDGTLFRIDPERQTVEGEPTPVGPKPRGVKVGFGYVWVANGGDGTLSRIDPETREPVGEPTKVGGDPADVAIGEGSVWTADHADSTVTRVEP